MKFRFFTSLILLWSGLAQANVQTLSFSLVELEKQSTDILTFDKGEKVPKGTAGKLYGLKKAFKDRKYLTCYTRAQSLAGSMKSLAPWIRSQQLTCAKHLMKKSNKTAQILQMIRLFESKAAWLSGKSYSQALRKNLVETQIEALKYFVKSDRSKAWRVYNSIDKNLEWLTSSQKAQVFSLVGQVAFIQQKLAQARTFYVRSLEFRDSKEIRDRLAAIQSRLNIKTKPKESRFQKLEKDTKLIASEEEEVIYNRLLRALESSDLLSAVEDGVKLSTRYPYGRWASWAEKKVIGLYIGLLARSDGKLALLKMRIRKALETLPADVLVKIAKKAFHRGYYREAELISGTALQKNSDQWDRLDALKILAPSQIYIGEYKKAIRTYERLLLQSAGTEESVEYLFRLGLLFFRMQDYPKAIFHFERLMALNEKQNLELSSLYWSWNSYLKLNQKQKAEEVAARLLNEYPLTYYGLRVRMAKSNGPVKKDFSKGRQPVVQVFLTRAENLAWERYQLLQQAGWYRESQQELAALPSPDTPELKLVFAHLWLKARKSTKAILLFNQVSYEDPTLLRWESLKSFFPLWYSKDIEHWAGKNEVSDHIVRAIIRQESSFDPLAESPARAIGLMQMIALTGKEVAGDLKIKGYSFPTTLHDPKINIRMGTYYFKKILRGNKYNMPATLAAYNVGMGNMYKWMKSRKDLSNLRLQHSSDAVNEIWMDELPWLETRFYVKAVMRNYLLYNWLYGELQSKPTWDARLKSEKKGS